MKRVLLAFQFVGVAMFAPLAAAQVNITTCGQNVPPGQVGTLQTDLVCVDGWGVVVENRATLDLGGFSLTLDAPGDIAVFCGTLPTGKHSDCTVRNGSVLAGAGSPIRGIFGRSIVAENVTVEGFEAGIRSDDRNVTVRDVTVRNSRLPIGAKRVRVDGLLLENNELALGAELVKGKNLTARDGLGSGVFAKVVVVQGLVAEGNAEAGVVAQRRLRLSDAMVTGNGSAGLRSLGTLKLENSMVTANGVDIASRRRPRIKGLVDCGSSRKVDKSGTILPDSWLVCAGD